MAEVALNAEVRRDQGSAASRRLRSSGRIPGVLYGHGTTPTALSVEARSLRQALNTDAGLNAVIQLKVDGKSHLALPRDIQRHPVRNTVSHVDFLVVNRDEIVTAEVPLRFTGEADGVTKQGGIVEHQLNSLTISARPTDIPTHIEVDISGLQIDQTIRVKDLPLAKGVTTIVDGEDPVVIGAISRAAAAGSAEDEAAAAAEGAAAPAAES